HGIILRVILSPKAWDHFLISPSYKSLNSVPLITTPPIRAVGIGRRKWSVAYVQLYLIAGRGRRQLTENMLPGNPDCIVHENIARGRQGTVLVSHHDHVVIQRIWVSVTINIGILSIDYSPGVVGIRTPNSEDRVGAGRARIYAGYG